MPSIDAPRPALTSTAVPRPSKTEELQDQQPTELRRPRLLGFRRLRTVSRGRAPADCPRRGEKIRRNGGAMSGSVPIRGFARRGGPDRRAGSARNSRYLNFMTVSHNMNCDFCAISANDKLRPEKEFKLEDIQNKVIPFFQKNKPHKMILTGGEPLIKDQIVEIAKALRNGLTIQLVWS